MQRRVRSTTQQSISRSTTASLSGVRACRCVGVSRAARAFTLLESLMASGILLTIVVTVTTAISAGQELSYEAQQRVAAAMAAEELLVRITAGSYSTMATWNGT